MDVMANGVRLHCERSGVGPQILMMHGGLGLDHALLRTHDALADRFELVYYDHRGHGRSDRTDAQSFEIATLHADAAALLDQVGNGRAVIYGHSYGAWLALGFALAYPERTAALVLCGGAAVFDYGESVMQEAARRDPERAVTFGEALAVLPSSDEAFRNMWPGILPLYFSRYEPRFLDTFERISYSTDAYATGTRHLATLNMVAQLGSLRSPTLLLVGDDDFITPAAQSRRIAAEVADAEVIEIPRCGHFPFLEQPDAYFAALRGWLERRVAG